MDDKIKGKFFAYFTSRAGSKNRENFDDNQNLISEEELNIIKNIDPQSVLWKEIPGEYIIPNTYFKFIVYLMNIAILDENINDKFRFDIAIYLHQLMNNYEKYENNIEELNRDINFVNIIKRIFEFIKSKDNGSFYNNMDPGYRDVYDLFYGSLKRRNILSYDIDKKSKE